MGFAIFGSGSDKTYQTSSQSSDMRTAVEGSVGTLISPGAAVASPGGAAFNVSPGATVTHTMTNMGLTGPDVQALLGLVEQGAQQQAASVTALGQSLATGIREQSQQVSDILAATKAPDATTLTKLVPLLIALAVIWALMR